MIKSFLFKSGILSLWFLAWFFVSSSFVCSDNVNAKTVSASDEKSKTGSIKWQTFDEFTVSIVEGKKIGLLLYRVTDCENCDNFVKVLDQHHELVNAVFAPTIIDVETEEGEKEAKVNEVTSVPTTDFIKFKTRIVNGKVNVQAQHIARIIGSDIEAEKLLEILAKVIELSKTEPPTKK